MKQIFCLALVMALFMGAIAFAADSSAAGAAEYKLLTAILTGALGTAFGLVVVVIGIYSLTKGNMMNGIIMIILGVLVVVLPTFYGAVKSVACGVVSSFGGCAGTANVIQ